MFYTYVLECANGSFYTGWTTDIESRMKEHNQGTGAKYTRANKPVKLVATWSFDSKAEAMSFEWHFKRLTRKKKQAMIASCDKRAV